MKEEKGSVQAEVRYLHQSGFELWIGERYLLFDYDGAGTRPDPRGLMSERAVVFASHRHGDHFTEEVLYYPRRNSALTLVLSDDIRAEGAGEQGRRVAPREVLSLPGLMARTLRSTDEGVAFLVRTEGVTVYHAGDLNWWHWEGEPEEWNRKMAEDYRAEIDTLAGGRIDLAFLPVDGRLGEAATWGADYFMERVGARFLIPMHFWDSPAVLEKLRRRPYAAQVCSITVPGEFAKLEL